MNISWVAVRNFAIIAAVAGVVFALQDLGTDITSAAGQIVLVLFVVAIGFFALNYFRQHELAWLVLKPWQRWLVIICGAGIAILVVGGLGFGAFRDELSVLGIFALIGVLGLVIAWVIRESRRFRI